MRLAARGSVVECLREPDTEGNSVMSWLTWLPQFFWNLRKDKRDRQEREQDRAENFSLQLEIKPRDRRLQVTAKVVNHSMFSIHVNRVLFYRPTQMYEPGTLREDPADQIWNTQPVTMKHGDRPGGEVKSKGPLAFHYITWNPGSRDRVELIPPENLRIEATTETGVRRTIGGEEIKAAALEALPS